MAVNEDACLHPGGYKLSVTIQSKYAPAIVPGRFLHDQPGKATFGEKRSRGDTNIVLWLDGSLYPFDPRSGKRPKFHSTKDFLEFVVEGENGLLGYINSVGCSTQQLQAQIVSWRDCLMRLETENALIKKNYSDSETARMQLNDKLKQSEYDHEVLSTRICELQDLSANQLARTESAYKLQVANMKAELSASNKALARLQSRFQRLKTSPLGLRSIGRPRKDLADLSQNGGHAKACRRAMRTMLAPATVTKLQKQNAEEGKSRRRMAGDTTKQIENSKVLGRLLTRTEVSSMLETTPKLSLIGVQKVNDLLQVVGSFVGPHEILETCDRSGITLAGYGAIYKRMKVGLQSAGKGFRVGCLPNPHQVAKLRGELNSQLSDFIGDYYSIEDELVIPANPRAKKREPFKIALTKMNSFFADVQSVQRTMVQLYNFTTSELNGRPLIFVLKLDEAEIIRNQKLERVSITIMNRALDPSIAPTDRRYIAVQSEREIFPIASFQVVKESHQVLSWVFSKSKIPALIAAQNSGEKLHVPEVGDFNVEWHLSADMKTIKCMYGLAHGVNSQYCCIYCNQKRVKPIIATEFGFTSTLSTTAKKSPTWSGGLFSQEHGDQPVSFSTSNLSRWKPILDIPLSRVHICTLHASNRICEKICHLHFMYAWTIRDKQQQVDTIRNMEQILSSTGAHGGDVKIMKDDDLSWKTNSIPNKPSLNGSHVSKIFQTSSSSLADSDRLWKHLVNAERDFSSNGSNRRTKLALWQALEDLRPYFTGLSLTLQRLD